MISFKIIKFLLFACVLYAKMSFAAGHDTYAKVTQHADKCVQMSVLSPALSISKNSVSSVFTSLLNTPDKANSIVLRRILKKNKVLLKEIFGEGTISNIFDVATGRGEWMKASLGQRWAAANARVAGFELKTPDAYPVFKHSFVDKEKDWKGLCIVHSSNSSAFPRQGSLDLLHESFIDVRRVKMTPQVRLNQYDRLIKNGGWFLFAHIDSPLYMGPQYFTDWLRSKAYPYFFFSALRDDIPEDYPRTRWWNNFMQIFQVGNKVSPNFLIAAQKLPSAKEPFMICESQFFEQSL